MLPGNWRKLLANRLRQHASPPKASVAVFLSTVVLAAVASVLTRRTRRPNSEPLVLISLSAALRLLREHRVRELAYSDGGTLLLTLKPEKSSVATGAAGLSIAPHFMAMLVAGSEAAVFQAADQAGSLSVRYKPAPKSAAQLLSLLLPFVLLFLWYRVAKSLLTREERFSSARKNRRPLEKTTFADVASRSKVELAEIVEYLNHPQKYKQAGAKLPRGALLVGPSGTGKTLLARAVAGEARCSFISASAAEFVEVYVGRGAARVRDLFRQAREASPVVLFFDELDALGSRGRRSDGRPVNEEYVQTLNQMLTELDGFHGQSDGVVVLAATNRQEAIDQALLRPGRFDRHLFIELPDTEERLEILSIHAQRAAMTANLPDGILMDIATKTEGFSGAELANLVNEAIFLAIRAGRKRAAAQDFSASLDRALLVRRRAADGSAASEQNVLPWGALLRNYSAMAATAR